MSRMPLWVVRRSESAAKRRGTQESTAMFARTRGPSRKPACDTAAVVASSPPTLTLACGPKITPPGAANQTFPAPRWVSTSASIEPSIWAEPPTRFSTIPLASWKR